MSVPVKGVAGLFCDGPTVSLTYRLSSRRGKGGRWCPADKMIVPKSLCCGFPEWRGAALNAGLAVGFGVTEPFRHDRQIRPTDPPHKSTHETTHRSPHKYPHKYPCASPFARLMSRPAFRPALPAGEAYPYACVFAHVVGGRNVTMAGVAQLVRAPVCGTGGRRFETGHSPHFSRHGSLPARPAARASRCGRGGIGRRAGFRFQW